MNPETRDYFSVASCTNPVRYFSVGRIKGKWQWANTVWSSITDRDCEITYWFHIGLHRNMQDVTVLELVVWKLHICIGLEK